MRLARATTIAIELAPASAVLAYWVLLHKLSGLRADHVAMGAIILILSYGGTRLLKIRAFILPFLLTAIVYDSQRFYSDWLRGPVHVREPYDFDLKYFGVLYEGRYVTLNQWWQHHLHPVLDLFCGAAYILYVPEFLGLAAYLALRAGSSARAIAGRMMWAFFWLNMMGYSTYYWYAAAPPWYVAAYGLATPPRKVPPDLAGCARFDQILGIPVFREWYARSADVFGAIPSLHVAYPLLGVFYAFRAKKLRPVTIAFYLWMCLAAVYLNHHYILDILWGSAYAVIVASAVELHHWHKVRPRLLATPA
jgi:hypothetical protein